MQIATLNYHYNPKDNFHNDSRSKFQHRHILSTVINPQKKSKQQRIHPPDTNINTNVPLPPITKKNKRPNSIRIKGNGLQSNKLNDVSISSFHQPSRSRSRQSNKTDQLGTRSRSITPSGTVRSSSKLVSLKFGYPVKIRSADFYGQDLSESELRFREDSFVNDSIRISNQKLQRSNVPHYDPFNDPNLKYFFQSPVVLDVVRKTLNIDLNPNENKRSKRNKHNETYHQIVAKHSSGYGKLNGYDCLPQFAPARQHRLLPINDRYQSSANTSLTSFPTCSSGQFQQKTKSHRNTKYKQRKPHSTSSPIRHSTAATNDTAVISNISQD